MTEFIAIKTRTLIPPKDDLLAVLDQSLPDILDNDIILIATKVLAIHQGRCINKNYFDKLKLIQDEADSVPGIITDPCITIKDHTFIPNSGIDESNGNGYYILWPKNVVFLLKEIHSFIKQKFNITNIGIISVDSHVLPMRAGTVGISQASFGFIPIKNEIGKYDLFGHTLQISKINIADSLSGIAPFLMGEANESCPIVIVRGSYGIEFCDNAQDNTISPSIDIFQKILNFK